MNNRINDDDDDDFPETKYQLHAKEIVKSMDVSKYDGIVCVSGDGVLVEVSKEAFLLWKYHFLFFIEIFEK